MVRRKKGSAAVIALVGRGEELLLDVLHGAMAGQRPVVGETERALGRALAPVGERRWAARVEIVHQLPGTLQPGLRGHHRVQRDTDSELAQFLETRWWLDTAERVAQHRRGGCRAHTGELLAALDRVEPDQVGTSLGVGDAAGNGLLEIGLDADRVTARAN